MSEGQRNDGIEQAPEMDDMDEAILDYIWDNLEESKGSEEE